MSEWTDLRAQLAQPTPESALVEWPPPIEYLEFETQLLEQPRTLVSKLLDSASRMIFAGGSKTFKTWAMSDLAISVAGGVPWWAFETQRARCLYVNFELKDFYMQKRLRAIRVAKQCTLSAGWLLIWNLRGYEVTLDMFKEALLKVIRQHEIMVVFVDPFYRLLGGRDERLSAEINIILAVFDEINRLTGATIVFAAHFTKGNQAAKESIDRISGGGSINRDPDNLLTLTKHSEEGAFTVEFTLRDFAPITPIVVRWQYPLLVRDDQLDPAQIKRPGRPETRAPAQLLELVKTYDDKLSTTALIEKAETELVWSRTTILRKLKELKIQKQIFVSKLTGNWNVESRIQCQNHYET